MKSFFKHRIVTILIDVSSSLFTCIAVLWLKPISIMIRFLPINAKIFMKIGLFPIRDHYYQPLINPGKHLKKSLRKDRNLPGIDLNIEEQLATLQSFDYNHELEQFSVYKKTDLEYYYKNGSFESGDAEFLYSMIRSKKPALFIEIGSGLSTLMANSAIRKNSNECEHICIEPYEAEWINQLNVEIIRRKVEDVNMEVFKRLQKNDILFIDSSHIIRPQGDVLFEYLEILPQLNSGVIIHLHDIFTPKDYLDEFIFKYHYLWNEQYLLEAFLSNNNDFRIIGAVNYLRHHHFEELSAKCPILKRQKYREPGSFWVIKN